MKELLPSYTLIGIASVEQLTCEIAPEPIEVLPRGITSHAIKTSAVTLRFREVWRGRADG